MKQRVQEGGYIRGYIRQFLNLIRIQSNLRNFVLCIYAKIRKFFDFEFVSLILNKIKILKFEQTIEKCSMNYL